LRNGFLSIGNFFSLGKAHLAAFYFTVWKLEDRLSNPGNKL